MDEYYKTMEGYNTEDAEPLFPINRIGTTKLIEGQNPLDGITASIRAGAGNIELGTMATGASNAQGWTFEGLSHDQREAIRELSRVTGTTFTTHASARVSNLSGLGQNGFNETEREKNVQEIKKAIDFAAEAANGGSVVVHTGEYQRSLAGNFKDKNNKPLFQFYEGEENEQQLYVANDKTGQSGAVGRSDDIYFKPKQKKENGKLLFLEDASGKPIVDDVLVKDVISRYNEKNGTNYTEEDLDKLPDKNKQEAYFPVFEYNDDNTIAIDRLTYNQFKEQNGYEDDEKAGVEFYRAKQYTAIQQQLGQARQYEYNSLQAVETRDELMKAAKNFQNAKSKEEIEKAKDEYIKSELEELQGKPEEIEVVKKKLEKQLGDNPKDFFDKQLAKNKADLLYAQEITASGKQQAMNQLEDLSHFKPMREVALERTRKSAAELGIYAMQQTELAKKNRTSDKIKPIVLTMENIFPEFGYGSAPEELIDIVKQSREQMAKELVSRKLVEDKQEADKKAAEHLKVTIDTGHLNLWRKNFVAKENESKEQTDKRFQKWYLGQIDKLVEAKVIGNVHLADNWGYDDSHLSAGQGNTPIRKFLEKLKESDYDAQVTSEGGFAHGGPESGMHEAWKMAGSSTYLRGAAGTQAWLNPASRWNNTQNSYMSHINKPSFIFKGYAPDNEDWQPWSETGLE